MQMSAQGRALLTQREGVRLKAYKDSVGVWTIGIGHTSMAGPPKVTPDLVITRAECDAMFIRDLVQYERAVNNSVKVPLAQHEFDALVSFCYNVGPGGFAKSTVVKWINVGDRQNAANALMNWTKPTVLVGRRLSEKQQFLTPYKDAGAGAVATGTAATGAVVYYFWQDPNFWPIVAGIVGASIIIAIIVHKYRNRKKTDNV